MADSYRRMRNTARFLLGNLNGFDPARDQCRRTELALDRWAVERTRACRRKSWTAYEQYQFHLIYQKIHNFCSSTWVASISTSSRIASTPRRDSVGPPLGADRDVPSSKR